MKNFNYSWRQITKASFVGIATTATFYLAKTTGLFSSWFLSEETSTGLADSKELLSLSSQQDLSFPRRRESIDAAHSLDPRFREDDELINAGQRRLLRATSGNLTLVNPIPDQIIQVGVQYQYSLDNVFSGNYSLVWAEQANGQPLPSWLSIQYKQLSTVPTGNVAYGVAVSGTTAFMADYGAGLQIVDVSNPSNPRVLSTVANSANGSAIGVAVSGTTAFVADYGAGLQIVDVSNASNPRVLSTVANSAGGTAWNVAVSGTTVFVADGNAGLQIMDVSNTSNPRLLSTVANSAGGLALGVAVSGTTAFVADYGAGLQIIDVSNASNPHILSRVNNSVGGFASVVVSGTIAYVADYGAGLKIVDVSNTSAPHVLSTVANSVGGNAYGVAVSGATVFVADYGAGLKIVDVSNASNPRVLSTVANSVGGAALGVAMSGTTVFVADGGGGFQIVDISQPNLMGVPPSTQTGQSLMLRVSARDATGMTLGTAFTLTCDQLPQPAVTTLQDQSIFPGTLLNLLLQSQLLFTNPRNIFLRLAVVLTNDQATPPWLKVQLSQLTVSTLFNSAGGNAQGIAVSGKTVFVTNDNIGLQIVDVSNPSNPRVLSTVAGGANGVAVSGTTAFVADYGVGLKIVDVSNTSAPRVLSTVAKSAGSYVYGVAVSGTTAFVADEYAGLRIVDVSNTSAPHVLSTVANSVGGYAYGVAVSGTTAFVADEYAGLQIVDVSNASNPRVLATVPSAGGSAQSVAVSGTTVFVANSNMGLQIVDVSNASNPHMLATVPSASSAYGVAVSGTTAFVADFSAGLQIVDVSNTSAPRVLSTVANSAGGDARGVAISGTMAFVADFAAGLQIIDLSQWQFIATPSVADVGNYRVQVTATDDLGGTAATQPFTIRVEGPPQFQGNISTQFAKVGQAFNYFIPQGLVSDPNFDAMVFTAMLISGQSLPVWLSFNAISATFAGTPPSSAVGNATILLSVTDNIAGSVNTTFVLEVSHAPIVNQRIADQVMGIGRNNSFVVPTSTFTHADNLPLVYSAKRSNGLSLPAWLMFNPVSTIFIGQPNATDAGLVSVQVTADDQAGGQASTQFNLRVENFPRINQPILAQSAGVSVPYRFSVLNSFVDDDGDTMTYQASQPDGSSLPSWLSFNAFGLEFSGTPASSDLETFAIRFSATDSYGGRSDQLFNMTVTYFPTVGMPIYPQVSCVDQLYQFVIPSNTFLAGGAGFTYAARQSNGQPLPLWLSLDGILGTFSGIPAASDVDQLTLTLIGSANNGGTASTDFTLTTTTCPSLRNPVASRVTNVNTPFALTLAGDTFDNGGMTLTLSAERTDHSALPNWLSFNPVSGVLAGVPLSSDVKTDSLQIVARNPLGGQAVAPFNLSVCYFPTLTAALPTIPFLRAQRDFTFTVPSGTFFSQTGALLQYQAQRADGSALPSWLAFNATQQQLFGTPGLTDLGNFNLQIIASDPTCGSTTAPLSLVVQQNYPPEVVHPLTNQVAAVGTRFTFFAPSDTFTDRNSDPLNYIAAQSNGQSLPGWLHFTANTLSFSGTPGRGDTDAFSDKVLAIALTAHDDKSQTSANFNINVQGTSNVLLFIKIAAPIFSVLTTALALYSQRGRILNHCKPQRYQRLEDYTVTVGEPFEYKFATPSEEIIKVRARIAKENKGCCRLFQVPRQALPGGTDLPLWMEYNPETNTLRTIGPVPNTKLRELFVQAKGSAERTLEQFTLRIVQPELSQEAELTAHPNLSSEPDAPASSGSGDVEMQTLSSTTTPSTSGMSF